MEINSTIVFKMFMKRDLLFSDFQGLAQSEDEYRQTQTKVNGLRSSPNSTSNYRPVELHNIPLPTTGGHVTAEVKMPSGRVDNPLIEDNRDGTVSVRYEPREEGLHELHIKYNSEHVQGSPFKFHVDSISSGYVTAYGGGLVHGITGEPCNFTISTKDAGAGSSTLRGRVSFSLFSFPYGFSLQLTSCVFPLPDGGCWSGVLQIIPTVI
ncbi:hypothetical protein SK128_021490 [Halocaridina rubra]|uniref:Filamin n=1 Tax=Halocaridina rubra TaxID=373956 RepID=A0AAN9A256_HALRR